MNKLLVSAALGLMFATGANATGYRQQTHVVQCDPQGRDKTADERQGGIEACRSAKKEPLRQTQIATCNAHAAGLKGYERETSMADCLKK